MLVPRHGDPGRTDEEPKEKELLMSAPKSKPIMYVPTENRQIATAPGLRGLVARHPATAFLVMAFGFGWSSLIPILLSENGFGILPIELPLTVVQALATVLGLALPAFLVTAATGGKAGVRDLLRRCFRWRVGVYWYLIALFGLLVAVLLAAIPFLGAVPRGCNNRPSGRTNRERRLGMSHGVGPCGGTLSGMVAWEKRRSLVMKSCLISIPAHRMRRWRACA